VENWKYQITIENYNFETQVYDIKGEKQLSREVVLMFEIELM